MGRIFPFSSSMYSPMLDASMASCLACSSNSVASLARRSSKYSRHHSGFLHFGHNVLKLAGPLYLEVLFFFMGKLILHFFDLNMGPHQFWTRLAFLESSFHGASFDRCWPPGSPIPPSAPSLYLRCSNLTRHYWPSDAKYLRYHSTDISSVGTKVYVYIQAATKLT